MKTTVCALLAACLPGAVIAQETHQHEAHVHGMGALDIAFEGAQVLMELRVPGADIVGFEHIAHDAEDVAAVEAALKVLSDPGGLVAFSEAASCALVSAEAELHSEDVDERGHESEEHGHDDHAHENEKHAEDDKEHAHEGGEHDHEKHDDHADDKHAHEEEKHEDDDHAHDDHADEAEGDQHSEFHAEYTWTCEAVDQLAAVELVYFKVFDRAEGLEVQGISDKGSFGAELSREAPVLELKGRI